MQTHTLAGTPSTRSVRTCAVFDPSDGRILHLHSVVTLEGAEERSADEIERRALALAAERGIDAGSVGTVHLEPGQLRPGHRYRIDTETKALVRIER